VFYPSLENNAMKLSIETGLAKLRKVQGAVRERECGVWRGEGKHGQTETKKLR